jgi:hypothetical protein
MNWKKRMKRGRITLGIGGEGLEIVEEMIRRKRIEIRRIRGEGQ